MGGVQIKNCTAVPLKIQLCQVGVLYHDLVQPGECFTRKTGAVHFTIRAYVAEEDDTNWKNTILPVFGAVLGSLGAVATAGVGAAVISGGALVAVGGSAAAAAAAAVGTSEGVIGGAVALTGAGLMTAGGVVLTKELEGKLDKEANASHFYISSRGWYFAGENKLKIEGGPKSRADRCNGSPLRIVDEKNSKRHS